MLKIPEKIFALGLLVALIVALSGAPAQAVTVTVATFAKPSINANSLPFTVDIDKRLGSRDNSKMGLLPEFPYSAGQAFLNSFSTTTEMDYISGIRGGSTCLTYIIITDTSPAMAPMRTNFESAQLPIHGFESIPPLVQNITEITGEE